MLLFVFHCSVLVEREPCLFSCRITIIRAQRITMEIAATAAVHLGGVQMIAKTSLN